MREWVTKYRNSCTQMPTPLNKIDWRPIDFKTPDIIVQQNLKKCIEVL